MKPIGVNTLNKVLPGLSEFCGLFQSYTHTFNFIIVTKVTTLHHQGFQMNDEQSLSGHMSHQSFAGNHYTSISQKHMMSRELYSRFTGDKANGEADDIQTKTAFPKKHTCNRRRASPSPSGTGGGLD